MARAYRTVSYEALCILTKATPILIEIHKIASCYTFKTGHRFQGYEIDTALHYTKWPHPADIVEFNDKQEDMNYTVEVFTDGSKSNSEVGSGIAIFIDQELAHQMQFKLHGQCSNNQAEQIAILKALEKISTIDNLQDKQKSAIIHTDSLITLDSLRNPNNHKNIIETIRKQARKMKEQRWTIHYTWVKAHVGIAGNELADKLAKRAARNKDLEVCYERIPESEWLRVLQEESMSQWEKDWQTTTKGPVTKSYFPSVKDRLRVSIPLNNNLTTFLTGHGKLRAYFHRFHILDSPECPCGKGDQTAEHLIFQCAILDKERSVFRNNILKLGGHWTNTLSELILKYKEQYIEFVQSVNLEKL